MFHDSTIFAAFYFMCLFSVVRQFHEINDLFFLSSDAGHYLGMDVHDSSMVKNERLLQPGVVSNQVSYLNQFLLRTELLLGMR